jgi:hypothetical protein
MAELARAVERAAQVPVVADYPNRDHSCLHVGRVVSCWITTGGASAATSALGLLGVVDELRSIVNATLVDGSTRLFDGH